MTLKWKRIEPGHYQCDDWHVKGAGTNWDLYKGRKHISAGNSKKFCQQYAEDPLHGTGEEPEVVEEPVAPKIKKSSSMELDSVLASLRLEVDQLAYRIASLDDAIRKSNASRDGLTNAILLLGRHVGKLAK